MRGSRAVKLRRGGRKAPRKPAGIGRALSGDTAEAAAFKKLVAEAVTKAVKSAMEQYLPQLKPVAGRPAKVRKNAGGAKKVIVLGKLEYLPGFADVWVGDVPYNLRGRAKAQLCLEYLVKMKALDASSARGLVDEIDPYVRAKGNFPRLSSIKMDDYFNDREGNLQILRRELIGSVRGDGRYFLKVV